MKNVLKIVSVFIGIVLLADAIFMGIVSNFNFGVIAALLLGAVIFGYGLFFEKINKHIPKLIRAFVLLGICCAAVMTVFLAVYGNTDNADYDEQAVIVLGAAVKGENPTLPLVRRLDKAVEYYEKNSDAIIVVSGGRGFQEDITEALAMEKYLAEHGVPKEKIVKEEKATSTYENFKFSKEILDNKFSEKYSTVLITNDFHVYRASRLAFLAGFKNISHISGITEWYTLPVNYLRECIAVIKLWILKR